MIPKRHRSLPPPAAIVQPAEDVSLVDKTLAFLSSDPFVNSVVAAGIAVGFFHGWLKARFPYTFVTFLFDALLILALGLVLLKNERGTPWFPPGPVGNALKAFYIVCLLYVVLPLPNEPPMMVGLAAVRGWCFATLMFCLGYHLTHSIGQVKGYFYVLILLGLMAAVYGIRQKPSSVEQQIDQDEQYAARFSGNYYAVGGVRQFRVFSTFISAGAFGGTMAYVAVFALVLVSDRRVRATERVLLAGAAVPIAYGMFLSGARSALMSLIFGFLVVAWFRRSFQNFVIVPLIILVAIRLASEVSGGAALERYSTLLKFEDIVARNAIPTRIGFEHMMDHPLGGGLGKSLYSVPFFMVGRLPNADWKLADGDLGRLMIEMGLVGLVFFGRLLWAALRTAYQSLRELRDTPVGTVALASAACIVMALASFPSGSPFLGIPMGALVWFFLGTLQKLADDYRAGSLNLPAAADASTKPVKRFRYYRPPGSTHPPHSPAP